MDQSGTSFDTRKAPPRQFSVADIQRCRSVIVDRAAAHRPRSPALRRHRHNCNQRVQGVIRFMFALFERLLRPTETPEHPEPPAGLIAFLWHFARQAKWLFVALFAVELFVALTDSAVPWFMGRIVTLVTSIPAERFLAETWPWLAGMALTVVVARPAIGFARYLITNQAITAP